MLKIKKINLTKKNISKKINLVSGLPVFYTNKIVDDLINILKVQIKQETTNIKNFASFKIINKKERIGRNPKSKKTYKINSMKSLKVVFSKRIVKQIKEL